MCLHSDMKSHAGETFYLLQYYKMQYIGCIIRHSVEYHEWFWKVGDE